MMWELRQYIVSSVQGGLCPKIIEGVKKTQLCILISLSFEDRFES